jgi:uncharacterized protein (TIGR00730 family)
MNVCVYCGSRPGVDPLHAESARTLGHLIATRGWGLVYGGGSVGLMGEVARAVRASGGPVTGIIPEFLATEEIALRGDGIDLITVPSMHTRKYLMIERSHAIIALPGGYGTLDELFEAITWKQLGLHSVPIGLLNTNGYFDGLIAMISHMVTEGFVRPQHANLFVSSADPAHLLDLVAGE